MSITNSRKQILANIFVCLIYRTYREGAMLAEKRETKKSYESRIYNLCDQIYFSLFLSRCYQ